ncbi:MAG: hypothetical protein COY66_05815 [Candidatus Kerfeldbacteria bacterium CG_4_10_14_0_8_um_filter_42_10]|uniref:Uncharacterized protein n=1 Tax=Candidatus Kerfeldbacteria bacterium CG_4_10_14_0_8_um_filter_42_10 TaxID=2014248 RepID=A0A2M7RGW1_9BACT|nr:MAG: hypothetical protein COY66_05815 [Candidatus Kerfeldbacteria bacterium CG_4_10_14_0_8_um_filter_42_10]
MSDETEKPVNSLKQTANCCRGCGLYIEWTKMKSGKFMPVEPELITVVTPEGETVKGRVPHWAKCSAAKKFKKRKV